MTNSVGRALSSFKTGAITTQFLSKSKPFHSPSRNYTKVATRPIRSTQAPRAFKSPRFSSQLRCYHSRFHAPLPTHEYTNSQTAILSAALKHVPDHGFTKQALMLGARDMGFLDVSIQLFSRQEMDLILFWLASRRGLLRSKVENGLFEGKELAVEEKIKSLVLERLRMNNEIIHRWQDALARMSLPSNIPLSISELHSLSSDILHLAGDASIDASWYTKRLSLSTVYASSEVVMTQDSSSGFKYTEEFVERRFQDNSTIGSKIGGVKSYLGFMAGTAVGLGRSWGLKI
ncbi:COQ9-domain-containing protein [Talaromyces proteolyticus]|uniref:Ubiquinone biosynthesis protein n=1 Tax=Talaromyces proteolyticus TaxID=1131652 RepID=A0AAD4KXY9_9EURO|nr:COQ9-domain-containing protein [Talaromyces proteolyticus]KAH8701868.1 COQ9-domain-containing protein [Talaromyces proteolyticus]